MNPNDMVKMKVLQGLKNHMANTAGQRLQQRVKPPAPPMGAPADPMGGAPVQAPGAPAGNAMSDDDNRRLMELYSKVK